MDYQAVQKIAKDTINNIKAEIRSGMSLIEVRSLCENKMRELGADSFWYYDIGAFVFSGDETTISVSGREYSTSDRMIALDDIITIDLSPQVGNTWGDYARTVIIQNGSSLISSTYLILIRIKEKEIEKSIPFFDSNARKKLFLANKTNQTENNHTSCLVFSGFSEKIRIREFIFNYLPVGINKDLFIFIS